MNAPHSAPPGTATLRARCTELVEYGGVLREASVQRRATWIEGALQRLGALDPAQHGDLAVRSGLSVAMVRWCLEQTLAPLCADTLAAFVHELPAPAPGTVRAAPGRLAVIWLSANVFTAPLRAMIVPLMLGWPVLAKGSSRDDLLAQLFVDALKASDAELGHCCDTVRFQGGDEERETVVLEQAEMLGAYGSDRTLQDLRARISSTTSFVGHGHGLGAIYLGPGSLDDEDQRKHLAREVALDVAAYDQRGCLSPHVICAPPGQGLALAETLAHDALNDIALQLPRGRLSDEAAAAQLQWRGVGAARGALLEGDGFSVCVQPDGPLRISPGHRNVQVLECASPAAFGRLVSHLGVHLKCVGVAGVTDLRPFAQALPSLLSPRICPVGHMQRPGLERVLDGVPAWQGLVRWLSHS